ncbi:hypothetical protein ANN_20355 [Periplaneta americana]|uniref:Uncharacterized protein n=1 Tax=Periplaneta americana TaxID=6978 RepID=A0ABQ8SD70_PERAM|nr:hypothetical protein ANN_20355 [Periplaneta americana]
MREVIQNQMELYEDFLKQENEELNENENKKDSDHEEQKHISPGRRDSLKKSTHFYEDGEGWKRNDDLPSPRRRNEVYQSHRTEEKWVRKPAYDRKDSEGIMRSYHGDTDRSHRKYSYRESEEKDYDREYEDRHHKKYKNSIDYTSQQRRSYHDRSSSYDSQSRKEYRNKSSSRDDHTGHRHRKNYDSSDSEKNRHQGYSYKEDMKHKYGNSDRDSARKSSAHEWEYSRRHRSEYTEEMSDDRDKYRRNDKRNKQLKRRHESRSSSDGNTSSDSEKRKKNRVAESAVLHSKDKHYQDEVPGYEPGPYRSQKLKASSSRDKEDDDSERSYVLKRSRNSECPPEAYSSSGYDGVRGIDDSRTEGAKRSPQYKHSFDWRNSVSSHDSETRHVKHKKKKKKKKRKHKKKEKRSPPDVHESHHSSDDYSC